ncbi:MAG TPA: hypothetical protein EYP35_06710 [Desulfobacterales bacterium]|nr:hypothetical protein [Desulfobacterales bacterium]HIP38434.1 hypothetical protein [Desulfocapsa sulfexigens]
MSSKLNREELAALEVGHTSVSRSLSRSMVVCFFILIFTVPVLQTILDSKNPEQQSLFDVLKSLVRISTSATGDSLSFFTKVKQNNNLLLENMDSFEKQLEEGSFLRAKLLVPGQRILLSLGYGNEKVYPGKESWLFYRPDMDYLMGPDFLDPNQLVQRREGGEVWERPVQPDPLKTIVDFKNQLARRNIQLVLMPTPIKASVHPELFSSGTYLPPLQNRAWQDFLEKVKQAGVPLFDPAPVLVNYHKQTETPVYLQTDTHWRADAMELVAEQLASYLEKRISFSKYPILLKRRQLSITNDGDIKGMLRFPVESQIYRKETVLVHPVVTDASEMWQADPGAEILLLGDSFSNIYSLSGMGWGEGAGLGEQLSYYLQQPIDLLLQNDAGAFATRELLAKELSRGRDRLAGKKVVIWQFATRELASGNWKAISMELAEKQESDFYSPLPGESRNVTATVAAVSRSPVPGSVPYKDNIVTLHLDDIRDNDTGEEFGQALIYAWGMKENTMMPLAKVRIGDQISLKLMDWEMVQAQYSSYRRSTLDDEMLELELPVWGETIQ